MTLQLHRPDGKGGLEKGPVEGDWRRQLEASRWGSGLRRRRLPALRNPEMDPSSTPVAIAFWLFLAVVTFVVLLAGYGSGFWH